MTENVVFAGGLLLDTHGSVRGESGMRREP